MFFSLMLKLKNDLEFFLLIHFFTKNKNGTIWQIARLGNIFNQTEKRSLAINHFLTERHLFVSFIVHLIRVSPLLNYLYLSGWAEEEKSFKMESWQNHKSLPLRPVLPLLPERPSLPAVASLSFCFRHWQTIQTFNSKKKKKKINFFPYQTLTPNKKGQPFFCWMKWLETVTAIV